MKAVLKKLILACMLVVTVQQVRAQFCTPDFVFIQDSTQFTINFFDSSGFAVDSFYWDFGDPSSTTDFSTLQNPSYTYPAEGVYLVCLTVTINSPFCSQTICRQVSVCNNGCVWPGDANSDGIANVYDIFNIGVGYGTSGPGRITVDTSWQAWPATNWTDSFPSILGGANYKHADCLGDGQINEFDAAAILANYSKTHQKTSSPNAACPGDPPLYVDIVEDSIEVGDTLMARIMFGTGTNPVSNGYAVAFTLNYTNTLIDSTISRDINVNGSWLNSDSLFYFPRDFYSQGRMDLGISRVTQTSISSGQGMVGEVKFVMEDVIIGKRADTTITDILNIWISNARAITETGTDIPLCEGGDSIIVYQITGIAPRNSIDKQVRLFPNPAGNRLQVELKDISVENITVSNILGQTVAAYGGAFGERFELNTSAYPEGIYFLTVRAKEGTVTRKFTRLDP